MEKLDIQIAQITLDFNLALAMIASGLVFVTLSFYEMSFIQSNLSLSVESLGYSTSLLNNINSTQINTTIASAMINSTKTMLNNTLNILATNNSLAFLVKVLWYSGFAMIFIGIILAIYTRNKLNF